MSEENKNVNGNDNAEEIQDQEKAQAVPENAPDRSEHMIPKSRFDQVVQQRKVAESALSEAVEDLVEEVPEDKRDLIPDLPPVEKIKWLRKATKAGIFGNQPQANGLDSKRPGGKPPTDLDNLSPYDMRAAGYKS